MTHWTSPRASDLTTDLSMLLGRLLERSEATALALAACSPSSAAPPPSDLRDPDAKLMRHAAALPDLPPGVMADATMCGAYGQCRVEHADVADRHSGLIAYVEAIRGRKSSAARQETVNRQ